MYDCWNQSSNLVNEKYVLFYQEELWRKRQEQRCDKLEYISKLNKLHCERKPVYGQDLCHTVNVFRDMNRTCVKDNIWKGLGMVYCHKACTCDNLLSHPNTFWSSTQALSDIVHKPLQYLQEMDDILSR